jgi:hypothetical protein
VARTSSSASDATRPRCARYVVGLLVIGLMLACAVPAGAVVSSGGGVGGARYGVQPLAGGPGFFSAPVGAGGSGVTYHGGPVVHGLTTYAIYWDPSGDFAASTEQLINGYLAGSAHDSGGTANVFSVAAQYGDGAGTAGYTQTYGGSFIDRDPYPSVGDCSTTTATAPTCIEQSQELDEIDAFVAANHLPIGTNDVYILLTPSSVVTCLDSSQSCSTNSYCSLHSYETQGQSTLLYITIPFTLLDSASDAKSCQDDGNAIVQSPNNDPGFGDVAIRGLAHEELETITDPLLNGWFDANGNEVADLCNGVAWSANAFLPLEGGSASDGTLYDQTIDGSHYYLQGAWSNEAQGCQLMSSLEPTIGGAPASVEVGTPITLTATPGTGATIESYAWSFGDGQTANGQSVAHSFATPGDYTVTLSLTDAFGNTGSATTQIVVTHSPGTTAGASGSSSAPKPRIVTRCGVIRHGKHGTRRRTCTTTTKDTQTKTTHRRTCLFVRGPHARRWRRRRCTASVPAR